MNLKLPQLPAKPANHHRLILVGDIVGKPGVSIVCQAIPWLRSFGQIDTIVANAENAADGAGLTVNQYKKLVEAGVDAITLGDHIYKKREIATVLTTAGNIVKPANFPPGAPGQEFCTIQTTLGFSIGIVSLLGRVFMRPVDCPFLAVDRVLQRMPEDCRVRLVDFHGEATSDKQTMARYLDGRVTAILGTHTHVPTADECVLPGGTAFQCDVGMTGPYESILGRSITPVLNTTLTFDPNSFHVATEDVRLSGTWVDCDPSTGKAIAIGRLVLRPSDLEGS
ncbi:TIGR00282 family metallophosphoesterase [Pirellulaceae bacterium SH467]